MKVIIANSLGIDSKGSYIIHSPSRWTEGVRKKENHFVYYPWELAYCSSLLKRETDHEIKFMDGCLERLNAQTYARRIIGENPDWLIMESASRVIEDNLRVALYVKKETGAKLVFAGHHASAYPEYLIEKGVDYVCIGEYEYTVLELLQGSNISDILGLYPNPRRPLLDIDSLPWPEDSDVNRLDYGIPGEPSSEYLEIQAYASRGCPNSCNFCVARNVYYASSNWRPRNVRDIVREIKNLKEKYPKMEGIFFDEEVHNVNKDFILNLTGEILDKKLNELKYEAMCNINMIDKEIIRNMKKAGYYKVRFGIETTDDNILRYSNKKSQSFKEQLRKIEEIKTEGIKTYGTFMMGMPGSSIEKDKQTIKNIEKMIKNDLLDNAQISICTPQPGTPFYDYANKNRMLLNECFEDFDGGRKAVISYPQYKAIDIERMMKYAFRRREHASFLRHISRGDAFSWLLRSYKKYGVVLGVRKLLKRCIKEVLCLLRDLSSQS